MYIVTTMYIAVISCMCTVTDILASMHTAVAALLYRF